MKKFIKKVFDILAFCLGITNTKTAKEAEKEGICDFSGQGRVRGNENNK
jgi:hypothetical protein